MYWTHRRTDDGKVNLYDWSEEIETIADVYTSETEARRHRPRGCTVGKTTFEELAKLHGCEGLAGVRLDTTLLVWPEFDRKHRPKTNI